MKLSANSWLDHFLESVRLLLNILNSVQWTHLKVIDSISTASNSTEKFCQFHKLSFYSAPVSLVSRMKFSDFHTLKFELHSDNLVDL